MSVTDHTPSLGRRAEPDTPQPWSRPPHPAPTAERIRDLLARPVVSTAEATDITGLSRSTIVRAVDSGELPVRRIGRRVLIATADLLAYVGAA